MMTRVLVVSAVCVLLSVWTHARGRFAEPPAMDVAGAIPLAFDEWVGRDAPPLDPDVARVLAADQYVHRYYAIRTPHSAIRERRIADREPRVADVEMDISYYARPQAGAAMHSPLNCLPGNGWQVIGSRALALSDDRSGPTARQLVVARGSDRLAMMYWFQNRGAIVGSEYRQRLQLLTNGLHGRPTDAALVRVMALDTRDGHHAIARFSRELASRLNATFR